MMKNFVVFCLLFCVICCGVFLPLATAGGRESQHTSTDKVLEFSLSSLKESMQKTMQKNDRLAFENDTLRKSIESLQQTRNILLTKRSELTGAPLSVYRPQDQTQLMGTADIEVRKQKTQELIRIFEQDIMQLERKIQDLRSLLREKQIDSDKKVWFKEKKESQKSLAKAEKTLRSLQKRNRAPLRDIEALKKEQEALIQNMRILEGRFSRFRRRY